MKKIDHSNLQVSAHNEWDTLKSVVVGIIQGARIPQTKDRALHAIDYPGKSYEEFLAAPCGSYPSKVINETEEDLERFSSQLKSLGIEVYRPDETDLTRLHSTELWSADGYYNYCPRDTITVIGEKVYATPMVMRHRQFEFFAYKDFFADESWFQFPLPRLSDELYDPYDRSGDNLRDIEPAFDAANILRFNQDILYLVSNTGNKKGARLLQDTLGPEYRVHMVCDIYKDRHIDTTFLPLKEGLLLCNQERVGKEDIPDFLKDWDILWMSEVVPLPAMEEWVPASEWIGLNVLSLSPTLAAVEENQVPLMKALKKHGIDSLPVRLRHCRTLGGGPHCITTDLLRV
jgi:scyllo-inosamine-4-phosphate amidinotransferase 1